MMFATRNRGPIHLQAMLKQENKVDKDRFEKLKDAEEDRGRDEEQAFDIAARQLIELREREGRSKDPS